MNLEAYRNESPPRRENLPGGAVLISRHIPSVHSVCLGFWLRTGAQDEAPSVGGLSHFLEHIVFKGSRSRGAFEIASDFDACGAVVDAFTTKDEVAFTVRVLPEYLTAACDVLADMLLRPAFEPAMIALEQDVICEEIQEAEDTPEDRLHDAFAAHVFGDHPRGRPILGTHDSVRGFDADLLRREHGRLCVGSNVVISVAGNIDERVREMVMRLFPVPAGPDPRAAEPVPAAPDRDRPARRLAIHGPLVQSYFEIGNLAVSYRHPDRIPLFVLGNILGGGMSSRIFQAVREREGLAYTVYNYSDLGRDTGMISCAGACTPGKAARVEEVVREEYARLIRDGIDDEELETNRAQIKSQLVFSLEGVVNQMYRAAKNEMYFDRFLPVTELVDQIDAVDRDAVVRCAAEYFDPDRLIVATHGPEPVA